MTKHMREVRQLWKAAKSKLSLKAWARQSWVHPVVKVWSQGKGLHATKGGGQ